MKKLLNLTILAGLLLFVASCANEDDVTPDTSNDSGSTDITSNEGTYFPLIEGNMYTYNSSNFGEYTIETKGTTVMNGKTFTISESVVNGTSQSSYIINENEKVTTIAPDPTNSGSDIELVIFDISKAIGVEWEAGSVSTSNQGLVTNNVYTAKNISQSETYTSPNGTTYNDVVTVELTTTSSATVDEAYIQSLPAGIQDSFRGALETAAASYSLVIVQTTYYAKDIGFVYQESEQANQLLNAELISKNF